MFFPPRGGAFAYLYLWYDGGPQCRVGEVDICPVLPRRSLLSCLLIGSHKGYFSLLPRNESTPDTLDIYHTLETTRGVT